MFSQSRRPLSRALIVLIAAAIAAMAISACGAGDNEKTDLAEGEPVQLGQLEYNVVLSRLLNPGDVEDREYLVGQPPPGPDQSYFGVFITIENKDDDNSQTLPSSFEIHNTEDQTFTNLPSKSIYALKPGSTLGPGDSLPTPDSTAEMGPTEGSMLLFRVTNEATERRPLVLTIPGEDGPATIDLDF